MVKPISILLIALFAAIGSGGAAYVHELQDHVHASLGTARVNLQSVDDDHDEATCQICLALHAPAIAGVVAAAVICLGLLVTFLTQIRPPLASQHAPLFVVCRGPPAL